MGYTRNHNFGSAHTDACTVVLSLTTSESARVRRSPQQLNDEEHSCKADIWSLGILVLECAAGHHPYIGKEGTHLTSGLLDLMQRVSKRRFSRSESEMGWARCSKNSAIVRWRTSIDAFSMVGCSFDCG